jgi:hypothetical protein
MSRLDAARTAMATQEARHQGVQQGMSSWCR